MLFMVTGLDLTRFAMGASSLGLNVNGFGVESQRVNATLVDSPRTVTTEDVSVAVAYRAMRNRNAIAISEPR
jgi:hypothetical protein